ncbi:MAG: T9SS C-terminal target domain-containing protein [Bacteroidetes bacterium]|nr:T9SS C-terminal target domain-containing protein [Bacteroidota bacterium]
MNFKSQMFPLNIRRDIQKLIITSILSVFCSYISAQPIIQWQKCLGGSGRDWVNAIRQTGDGGFIVAGFSMSNDGDVTGNHGNSDFWIVKLNDIGTIQWQKSLGGSNFDQAYSVQQTTDSGYIVAGYSDSDDGDVTGNHGLRDFWVVKLNDIGTIQWQKSLGGSNIDQAYSIIQTADGGYIVAGGSESTDGEVTGNHGNEDCWVVKLSDTGTIQWQKCLGGSSIDKACSIQQTTDGGYIVSGNSTSNDGDVTGNHGNNDYWVVKLNDTGTVQWQNCLGGSGIEYDCSVQQTTDGGYIIAGGSTSNDGDVTGNHGISDFWLVKLNDTGNIQWQKSLGGSDDDCANSIRQTADSGYIVAGISRSNDGDVTGNHGFYDFWVVKVNNIGTIQWQKSIGGSDEDYAFSIRQTTEGGYVVAGFSRSNDGDVTGNHGFYDYWVVRLSGVNGLTGISAPGQLSVFPNPADD